MGTLIKPLVGVIRLAASTMYNVAVVGCGAIGLTTALEIQKILPGSANITIFTKDVSPYTTSDIAAGLWEPYLLQENNEDDIIRWSKVTYDYLLEMWKQGKAKDIGICLQPAINLYSDENFKHPKWAAIAVGCCDLSPDYLVRLGKQIGQNINAGFLFVTFTWEARIFLPYLQNTFTKNGGRIIERHIRSLSELTDYDVMVNCTGLNARRLIDDDKLIPIRGQIVNVEAPWQNVIYIVQSQDDNSSCYIIPNTHTVILGGTKQESFNTRIDEDDYKKILRNTLKVCPSLEGCRISKHQVGLRPGRNKVRLEGEFLRMSDGRVVKVVHNYGHGGAGITLSVGCAREAASLVQNLLKVGDNKL
ncbi:D-aspartate oxidase [Cylas formicarius]|uniref:D-aspartate oxidase n=1 Tax=Cylas formicarius TaxID=197179 RepID=UPI002958A488|nr:D-aspartate oxidase [Cylas formicarius]